MLSYSKYEKELFRLDEDFSIDQYSAKIIAINGILDAGDNIWKKEQYCDFVEKVYPGEQYYGVEIVTESGTISAYIDSYPQCCERFGAILSQDDISCFVGTRLNKVYLTNVACQNEYLDYIFSKESSSAQYCNVQFINFETDKGIFQLTVYNCDNGYYGHDVVVKCDSVLKYKKTFSGWEKENYEQSV